MTDQTQLLIDALQRALDYSIMSANRYDAKYGGSQYSNWHDQAKAAIAAAKQAKEQPQ